MSRVITFSRVFPAYHPKKGHPTYFVEKIFNGAARIGLRINLTTMGDFDIELSNDTKYHTIRSGSRWKVGDRFSPRVWSGKPYCSPMITIAPDIEIKKIWEFEIKENCFFIGGDLYAYSSSTLALQVLAYNDGLDIGDLLHWFKYPKPFKGQIICWNKSIEYKP